MLDGGFAPRPPARHVSTGELFKLFDTTQTAAPRPVRPPHEAAYEPTSDANASWRGSGAGLPDAVGAGRPDEQFSRLEDDQPGNGNWGRNNGYDAPGYGEDRRPGVERVWSDDDL
jgi:hypothetical protein